VGWLHLLPQAPVVASDHVSHMDVSQICAMCTWGFSSLGVSGEEGAARPDCRDFLTRGAGIVSWLNV
jgi:hypothetical protein